MVLCQFLNCLPKVLFDPGCLILILEFYKFSTISTGFSTISTGFSTALWKTIRLIRLSKVPVPKLSQSQLDSYKI